MQADTEFPVRDRLEQALCPAVIDSQIVVFEVYFLNVVCPFPVRNLSNDILNTATSNGMAHYGMDRVKNTTIDTATSADHVDPAPARTPDFLKRKQIQGRKWELVQILDVRRA